MNHTSSLNNDDDYLAHLANFRLHDDASSNASEASWPEQSSNQSWLANPLIQLGVVGSCTGLLALSLFLVLNAIMNNGPTPNPNDLTEEKTDTGAQQPSYENGAVKTSLAFGEQADALAALSTPPETPKSPEPSVPTVIESSAPITRPVPPPVRRSPLPLPAAVNPVTVPVAEVNPQIESEPSETHDAAIASLPPAIADDVTEESLITLITGTRATAIVETPILATANSALAGQVRLTETLLAADGSMALPSGTLLIASTQNGRLQITGYVHNNQEHDLPPDAIVALDAQGVLLQPPTATPNRNRLNWERVLLTGALGALELERDDFLTGVGLDILNQITEQDAPHPDEREVWLIPTDTAVIVHVNSPVSLPKLPSQTPDDAPSAASPVNSIVLYPNTPHDISYSITDETVMDAWVDTPELVTIDYDPPLVTGDAQTIYLNLTGDSPASHGRFLVITQTSDGTFRWHRYDLLRHTQDVSDH